jgi:uncharacterized protein (DUF58 family)
LAWTGLALLSVPAGGLAPTLAFAAAFAIAVAVWDAAVLWRPAGPSLARELPQRAVIRRDAEVALAIASGDPVPLRIDVFEEVPRDLCDSDPEFRGVALGAGASLRLTYTVRPALRGTRPLGRVGMLVRTRLGLAQRRLEFPAETLRVHPDTSGLLRREALDPKRMLAAIGVKRARPRGSGLEFETLREYVAGDDVRHIDWRATARRGRTMTRLYRHERDHPVVLAIDASRLMGASCGRASTLDFAIEAALALAYTALHHGDRVGLAVFDAEMRAMVAPRRSRRALGRVIEAVWDVQPRLVEPDYVRLAGHLARRQRQRALIVLLTDFAHAGATAVLEPLAVLARQHRLLLVALRNPLLDAVARGNRAADPLERYRRLVVDDLLHERGVALAELRRRGVQTLDVTPDQVTPPLLNRYLAVRFGES